MKPTIDPKTCPYSVTGVTTFRGREGYGLNAYLIRDGRKIADATDDANGGVMRIHWLAKTAEERQSDEAALKAYAATLPKWGGEDSGDGQGFDHDAESVIHELADAVLMERDVKGKLSRGVLLKIKGMPGIRRIPKAKPTPDVLAQVRLRHPEAVILNDLPLADAVAAFRAEG